MKRILTVAFASLLVALPLSANAQMMLTSLPPASLSIMPVFYSNAPAFMLFDVQNPSGTESIDFGDGHMTGSNGCVKNAQGWCDLSHLIGHRYDYPGSYLVTLYAHYAPGTYEILSTTTVRVTPAWIFVR